MWSVPCHAFKNQISRLSQSDNSLLIYGDKKDIKVVLLLMHKTASREFRSFTNLLCDIK